MTQNARFKKLVRARMEQTGENYTTARRVLLAEQGTQGGVEPHYAFTPPAAIEYVDAHDSRYLPVPEEARGLSFSWGYAGTGPNTAAWAVLLDATGSCDQALAIAFTSDNLDWWDEVGDKDFAITVAEVRAWRVQAEARVQAEQRHREYEPRVSRFSDMRKRIDTYKREAQAGPHKPWWRNYRDSHGEPSLP